MSDTNPRPLPVAPRPATGGIRRLERSFFLIWAYPAGESIPFEVSKEVTGPLQPQCKTSPYCPDERIPRIRGRAQSDTASVQGVRIASVVEYERNPNFKGVTSCPYAFKTKEDCYRDINVKALTAALFAQEEVGRVGNFLRAMGYRVEFERIGESEIDGARILKMHGQIYSFHETRFEVGPNQSVLCMIRSTVGNA